MNDIIAGPGCQAGVVLHDVRANGKETPWAQHKMDAQLLSYALMLTDPAAGMRVYDCANTLVFRRTESGHLKLAKSRFCRVRLCPICQWRRSLKMYGQLRQVVDILAQERKSAGFAPYKYVLLTLTIRNCDANSLPHTLDALSEGWHRLTHLKQYKAAIKGSLRCIEITYNRKMSTFHPHIHALCAVLPSYFTGRTYISQAQWRGLWAQSIRTDYNPQVDIRRVKDTAGAAAEVAKYATKPGDYLDASDVDMMASVVGTLQNSCRKRRFACWAGVLRDAHRRLHLDDTESGDLIHVGADSLEELAQGTTMLWDWYPGPKLYIGGAKNE